MAFPVLLQREVFLAVSIVIVVLYGEEVKFVTFNKALQTFDVVEDKFFNWGEDTFFLGLKVVNHFRTNYHIVLNLLSAIFHYRMIKHILIRCEIIKFFQRNLLSPQVLILIQNKCHKGRLSQELKSELVLQQSV